MGQPILPGGLWKRLEPLIPKPKENRYVQFAGRKPSEPRRVVTGILFVLMLTDANGIPLAVILTEANRHDVTQLLPLLDKIPRVKGKRGAPRCRPDQVQGDRAYDSEPHRQALKKRG